MSRSALVLALAACALGVGLRLALVPRQGLWADEVFSLAMATGHSLEHAAALAEPARGDFVEAPGARPLAEYASYLELGAAPPAAGDVLRAVRRSDTSPPLYYVLLAGWVRALGTSDAALRGLSVLLGALTLWPLALLAREAGGPRAVAPACLLFALSPLALHYSSEARMYALVGLEATVCLLATLRLREGVTPARALVWLAATTAGLLTHYFFALAWAAGLAWLWLQPGEARRRVVAALALAGALVALPWYAGIPQDLAAWRVTAGWQAWRPGGWTPGLSQLALPGGLVAVCGVWGVRAAADLGVAAALIALALLLGRAEAGRLLRGPAGLLAAWALGACAGVWAFDLWRDTYAGAHVRYAYAALPAVLTLIAAALARLPARRAALVLGALALVYAVGARRVLINESRSSEPMRELAAALAPELAPGDLVVIHSIPSGVTGVARYLAAAGAPPQTPVVAWVEQLGERAPDAMAALAAGYRRVHWIDVHAVGAHAPEREWLETHGVVSGRWRREAARRLTFVPARGEAFAGVVGR